MDNQIVCPNCGAPNEATSDTCQFCGASLPVQTKRKTNRKKKAKNSDSSSKITVTKVSEEKKKGRPQIKYDERVFELIYDEMEDEAELYLSDDIISLEDEFKHYKYYFNFNYLWLGTIKTIVSDGLKYEFHDSISIEKENLDLLETFCNLNPKNCNISEISEGKEFLFILVCRAFYNTIFDHSKYTDAADKLYEYCLQSDEYKRKVERDRLKKEQKEERDARVKAIMEEKKDREDDKRINRQVNGCLIIFGLVFVFLPMIGMTVFPDTWFGKLSEWILSFWGWLLSLIGID